MFDIKEIQEILPHGYPFLLIDRILELEEGKRVIGLKNVTFNEEFFQGHFPGNPVMPGVLILEAMAQVGGFAFLHYNGNQGKTAYFTGVDKARFRQFVRPGDQLIIKAEFLKMRSMVARMQVEACVDGNIVAEGIIMFTVR